MRLLLLLFTGCLCSLFFSLKAKATGYKNKELDSLTIALENHQKKDTVYLNTLITLARKVRQEDFGQSEKYFEDAIGLSRKLADQPRLIRSLNGIGITYGMQDKYAEAIRHFNEAAKLSIKYHYPDHEETSYSSLGIVYKRMGDYPSSLLYYSKSLKISEDMDNDEATGANYHNLGVLFDLMKEPEKSMEYYTKALELYRKIKSEKDIALLQENIAILHLKSGNFNRALELFHVALSYYEANNQIYNIANAHSNLGNTYYKMGEFTRAESHLQPALETAETHNLIQLKSMVLYNLAKIKAEQGDFPQSLALARRVEVVTDSTASIKYMSDAQELLSFVYEKSGNPAKALEYRKKFNALQDSLFNESKARSYKNQQVMMEVHEKDKQLEAQTLQMAFLNQEVAFESRWKWTLGFASFFLLLAGSLYYQKYRQRLKYSGELESKNTLISQQKREIEEINLQLEKRMLRAQMNPHFIFNALSSIQHFITTNDKISALHYLSHFSNMLRQILETSVNVNMALKDEIELIKIYLDLEALRFENGFDYDIIVDDQLDIEMLEIPTMIIQPFVENAILHGLMPKKCGRELYINLRDAEDQIVCTITDNGIGREAAELLNKSKTGKAQSRGISVTRQRLDLLARNYGLKTDFRYVDLKDEAGNATGTQVVINIPKQEL